MQYLVKIYNSKTNDFVGYYKEVGKNCITSLPKGAKLFTEKQKALEVMNELDSGFLRDKDKHWYTAFCSVYGDSTKEPPKEEKKSIKEKEEELEDALDAFIRKNSSRN